MSSFGWRGWGGRTNRALTGREVTTRAVQPLSGLSFSGWDNQNPDNVLEIEREEHDHIYKANGNEKGGKKKLVVGIRTTNIEIAGIRMAKKLKILLVKRSSLTD
jgi:hypothetical protein